MSEEQIKDFQRRINNLESRMGGLDLQVKGFYDAMESIRTLAQSMAEVFSGGVPEQQVLEPVKDKPVEVEHAKWPALETGKYVQSLTGTIVDNIVVKEVETQRGPTNIANFKFTDGVTVVRMAIWGDLVDELQGFSKGDTMTLKGLSVKDPYEGMLQVSSTRNTKIG